MAYGSGAARGAGDGDDVDCPQGSGRRRRHVVRNMACGVRRALRGDEADAARTARVHSNASAGGTPNIASGWDGRAGRGGPSRRRAASRERARGALRQPALHRAFDGWTAAESEPLLRDLVAHATAARIPVPLSLEPTARSRFGTTASAWHYAVNDYPGGERDAPSPDGRGAVLAVIRARRVSPAPYWRRCSRSSRSPAAAVADDSLTVVGGSTASGFFEVLDLVAQQAGFFKDEHLIVDKQYLRETRRSRRNSSRRARPTSLRSPSSRSSRATRRGCGSSDFSRAIRVTCRCWRCSTPVPIRTLADFKGATIGEYSAGSAAEVTANSELAGAGLKRSDYTYLPIGAGAQAIAAMTSGKVAGVAFPYPELVTYTALAGQKYRYFWHPILKDIPASVYAASPATIQTRGDVLRRFSRALVKASISRSRQSAIGGEIFRYRLRVRR